MTDSKHTPGPWKAGRRSKRNGKVVIDGNGWYEFAKVIVRMKGCSTDNEQGLANARLIAAAPDMIDALKQWASAELTCDDAEYANACKSRDLAIAKAEGRS